MFRKIIIFLSVVFLFGKEYAGYFPLEADTALTFWGIKKYVDKNAKFYLYNKDSEIKNKIEINTKSADIKRNGRYTAFEMLIYKYKIPKNRCINKLIKTDRVLEMMPWRKNEYPDFLRFEKGLLGTYTLSHGEANLSKMFKYIDNYCKK